MDYRRAHEPTCPVHGQRWVYGAIGSIRCPVIGCEQHRRTTCGAFVRRIRPVGRTLVCERTPVVETWAVRPDGHEQYVTGRCEHHPDTARYIGRDGTAIDFRRVPTVPSVVKFCAAMTAKGHRCRRPAEPWCGGLCGQHARLTSEAGDFGHG